MTYQEVHNLCKRVSELNKRLRLIASDIKVAQLEMSGITAIQFDHIPVRRRSQNTVEERYVRQLAKIERMRRLFDRILDELMQKENQLLNLMDKLDAAKYELILHRFFGGLSVKETCKKMEYKAEGLKNLQRAAFALMAD